jgi:hypothetical protein
LDRYKNIQKQNKQGCRKAYTGTMSWSLIPGIGQHLLTKDGRFVRKITSVLLCLVRKSTICWLPISLVKSIHALLIPTG